MRSVTSSVLALLSIIASPVLAETTHGLVVFSRHGDSKQQTNPSTCHSHVNWIVQEHPNSSKDMI